jgi:hypothetical protein
VKPAPALEILKMNKTEWHYLLFGTFGAAINGAFPFVFAFLLGEIFGVSGFLFSNHPAQHVERLVGASDHNYNLF